MTRYNKQQSGVVLIVGLIMLLLLTIIMISALQVTALEERMAGNLQNSNIAFQAAESALRQAEAFIRIDTDTIDLGGNGVLDDNPFHPLKLSGAPFRSTDTPVCVYGLCSDTSPLQSEIFPSVSGTAILAGTGISTITREPEYIIELIRTDPSVDSSRLYATFRITARAWGGDSNSLVQLQSTYRLHALSFSH